MAKSPQKPRKKLPKKFVEMHDRAIMERLFGKRTMNAVNKVVAERSKDGKWVSIK